MTIFNSCHTCVRLSSVLYYTPSKEVMVIFKQSKVFGMEAQSLKRCQNQVGYFSHALAYSSSANATLVTLAPLLD